MKKIGILIFVLLSVGQVSLKGGDGGAIAAGMAAGMFTGIATSAIANNNRSSDSNEVRQMRREQQQEKIDQVRRDVEVRDALRKDEQLRQLEAHLKNVEMRNQSTNNSQLLWILSGLIGLLFIALIGVGFFIIRRNK